MKVKHLRQTDYYDMSTRIRKQAVTEYHIEHVIMAIKRVLQTILFLRSFVKIFD